MNGRPPTQADAGKSTSTPRFPPSLLLAVRYVLPVAIVIAGIVVMTLGGESNVEGGAAIAGAGLASYFINVLFRLGVAGERQRDAEDAARDYFDAHGRWPQ
ncbi:MAG TPA: hypothetical protein VH025_00640 [Solirubrobacteraceae bacterium]|jgi:hypothetical protein|nr:hypothetical protein [Solirubrobacteraceae bacterium]